jgi:hypothetical protein
MIPPPRPRRLIGRGEQGLDFWPCEVANQLVVFPLRNRSRGRNLLIYYGLKKPKFRNSPDFASALQANLLI